MKVVCSAPGKVIISGEHSVVYGRHAIVTAVSLRCYVTAEESREIRIRSQLGETGIDYEVHPYISSAIDIFKERFDLKNVEITVESEIPIASGLGSSAAVTVATLKALSELCGAGVKKEQIFEMAREVELRVQGRASGVDPFVSTFGGAWLMPERERFDFDAEMLVVDSGESSVTTEMVRRVAELRERLLDVVERVFDAMDSITLGIKRALESGGELAELFRMNHCMLKAIGVSTPLLDRIVEELGEEGLAAKLTGAGGGGCVLAVGDEREVERGAERLKNFRVIRLKPERDGVRVES